MNDKILKQSPVAKICAFLVLLFLIGISTYFLLGRFHRTYNPTIAKSEPERIQQLNGYDKANLARKDAHPGEVFAALVRLAQQNDPEGLKESLARLNSDVKTIREGVAASLGYYEDKDVFAAIGRLLKDQERSVRVQAIYALGRRQTPERESTLQGLLNNPELASDEKIAVYSSFLQLTKTPEAKDQILGKISNEVLTTKDINLKLQGILIITQSGIRSQQINEMLKAVLLEKDSQSLAPVVIRNLGLMKDPWFEKNLGTYLKSKEEQTRMAALQVLRFSCPANRFELLGDLLKNEMNLNIIKAAIQEIRAMPGPSAESLVKDLIQTGLSKGKDTEIVMTSLKEALPSLGNSAGVDPCEFAKEVQKRKH